MTNQREIKMRDIRFRAWDKNSKRMLEVSHFSWHGRYQKDEEYPSVMAFGTEEDDKERIASGGSVSPNVDGTNFTYGDLQIGLRDFELMQYTGLKDKKRTEEYPEGQEIYEGDLVEGYWNNKAVKGEVNFREGMFGIDDGDAYSLNRLVVEVIGNVYENGSELLEDKKEVKNEKQTGN